MGRMERRMGEEWRKDEEEWRVKGRDKGGNVREKEVKRGRGREEKQRKGNVGNKR